MRVKRKNTNTNIYKNLHLEVSDSSRHSYFYDLCQLRTWKYKAYAARKRESSCL